METLTKVSAKIYPVTFEMATTLKEGLIVMYKDVFGHYSNVGSIEAIVPAEEGERVLLTINDSDEIHFADELMLIVGI